MKRRRASLVPAALDRVLAGAPLPPDTARYLTRVLRLPAGATVEVGDGGGRIAAGRLVRLGPDWIIADAVLVERGADALPVTLYAGLLKPKRWNLVLEKSVELGVARLVPVLSEHATVRPRPAELDGHLARWNRLALEAVKQCRRATATLVSAPMSLAEALAEAPGPNRLLADAEGAALWPEAAFTAGEATQVLVGPEGGLTTTEREAARDAGFVAVSLGGFAVRAETAAIALLAMVRDRLGFAAREHATPCL